MNERVIPGAWKSCEMLALLLLSSSAFMELNDAHRAFVTAPEAGKAAAQTRLGQLYAKQGMQASARFFFERALKADPRAVDAKAGLAALAEVPPPQAEAQLGSLAQRLFGTFTFVDKVKQTGWCGTYQYTRSARTEVMRCIPRDERTHGIRTEAGLRPHGASAHANSRGCPRPSPQAAVKLTSDCVPSWRSSRAVRRGRGRRRGRSTRVRRSIASRCCSSPRYIL